MRAFFTGIFHGNTFRMQIICETYIHPASRVCYQILMHRHVRILNRSLKFQRAPGLVQPRIACLVPFLRGSAQITDSRTEIVGREECQCQENEGTHLRGVCESDTPQLGNADRDDADK